jgi:hypothetical protein
MENKFGQSAIIDNQPLILEETLQDTSVIPQESMQKLPQALDAGEGDSEKEKNFETLTLEIEGKNYEVIKTHFTYPETIQKENSGVEGYDRFELSWDDFDKEKLDEVQNELKDCKERDDYSDKVKSLYRKEEELLNSLTSELNSVSEKLGVGTEMKEETISHYVGAVKRRSVSIEWSDNRFFLNKPFDIKNHLKYFMKDGMPTSSNVSWHVFRDGKSVDVIDYIKQYSPEYARQYDGLGKGYFSGVKGGLKDLDYLKLLEFFKDKDLICKSMSFAPGSHLSSGSHILGGGMYRKYSGVFFNFNSRNTAFEQYIKNIKEYKETLQDGANAFSNFQTSGTYDNHPKIPMVFTDKFPAFRWCFADTAYVPMKDGPNFFRFYTKDSD